MRRIVYFDLETRLLAKQLHPDNETGWRMLREGKGGISALAIYDSVEKWVYLYDDKSVTDAAAHLESADVAVGFRTVGFDVPVIEGLFGRALRIKEHVDLYEYIQSALAARFKRGRVGEYKLNTICKRTLGRGKLENGEDAPGLAKRGLWARLFRYCMDDVRLTRDLFHHIQSEGGIISAESTFLPVELPSYLRTRED